MDASLPTQCSDKSNPNEPSSVQDVNRDTSVRTAPCLPPTSKTEARGTSQSAWRSTFPRGLGHFPWAQPLRKKVALPSHPARVRLPFPPGLHDMPLRRSTAISTPPATTQLDFSYVTMPGLIHLGAFVFFSASEVPNGRVDDVNGRLLWDCGVHVHSGFMCIYILCRGEDGTGRWA